MIKLVASTFRWSSDEQVYPLEQTIDGGILYAKEVNLGNLPDTGLLSYSLSSISSGLTEDKIHRLICEGVKEGASPRYIPITSAYRQDQYSISLQAYGGNIEIETNVSVWAAYTGYLKIIYQK